jgi:osmotically inducible protein OsmC
VPRIERQAEAVWEGNVARGSGSIGARSSGAFELPYSLATRVGNPEGKTSPEELVAAAHAGCFAMSLASELTQAGTPPERISVQATCVMDEVEGRGHLVVASQLGVSARAAGLDEAAFSDAVEKADAGCPISTLIRGTAEVRISARLES